MRKLYQRLINYSVEQRIKKNERRGINSNREKIIKEMEAVNPIGLLMVFQILIWFVDDTLKLGIYKYLFPYMQLFLIILILFGLNHYFGWIKIKK